MEKIVDVIAKNHLASSHMTRDLANLIDRVENLKKFLDGVMEEKPTYGDTEWDVARLNGKKAVAEEILENFFRG